MKNFLRVSLLANVMFCGLVFWLVRQRPAAAGHVPAAPTQEKLQPTIAIQPEQLPTPVLQPFRWSQLESSDYHTYLANLRNIGCPEQTIRDIITADVDSVFAQRREEAERVPGNTSALQSLREQETVFLASLFGDAAAPASAPSTKEIPPFLAQRTIRPVMPLAFKEVDPTALDLNSNQVAMIADVRRQFQEQLANQDTNDPAYVQRWNQAQHDADDRLRGLLDSKFLIQYQAAAAANQTSR